VNWVTIHRVCGELAVSRSIGDPDYKSFTPGEKVDAFFLWPEGHDQVFLADLVIPIPECKVFDISPADEFVILASDGLWDVLSSQEAVAETRAAFEEGKTPSEAAELLCEKALKLGSSDNVTVVIVQFVHPRS
jgi:serine/threonine protein phosphatase PrpC